MELHSLKIDLRSGQGHVVLVDAGGASTHKLAAESLSRVLQAAEPLLVRLAQEGGGPVQLLSIEPHEELLCATCLREDGDLRRGSAEAALIRAPGGANMGEVGEVLPHVTSLWLTGVDFRRLSSLMRDVVRTAAREARPRQPDPAFPPGPDGEALRWEHKYLVGGDGWELMRPAPPLQRWLSQHPPTAGARALVAGCGRGHEARLLARAGAQVTAIDIAPTAVAEARRLAEQEGLSRHIDVQQADVFHLPGEPQHRGRYDLLLEHCCFCAIEPSRRDEYVLAARDLLRPEGQLLGLFWCHPYPGGPPYSVSPQEVEERFAPFFTVVHKEVPGDSILARSEQELLVLFSRRPDAA